MKKTARIKTREQCFSQGAKQGTQPVIVPARASSVPVSVPVPVSLPCLCLYLYRFQTEFLVFLGHHQFLGQIIHLFCG